MSNVLVAGLTRNSAAYIEHKVSQVLQDFEADIILVESDSRDDTKSRLRNLENEYERVKVCFGPEGIRGRYTRLFHNRLCYLRQFMEGDWDVLVVVDWDLTVDWQKYSDAIFKASEKVFNSEDNLIISAGAKNFYYDFLALQINEFDRTFLAKRKAALESKTPFRELRKIYIDSLVDLNKTGGKSVFSAFGGLAIYSKVSLSALDLGSLHGLRVSECEHVVFHRLLAGGQNLVTISSEILLKAPKEHRPPIGLRFWLAEKVFDFFIPQFVRRACISKFTERDD